MRGVYATSRTRRESTIAVVIALAVTTLVACGVPEQSAAPAALAAIEPTPSTEGPTATSDVGRAAGSALVDGPMRTSFETPRVSVPLEVRGGTFLGIGTGSFLADALAVLGVAVVFVPAGQPNDEQSTGAAHLTPCSTSAGDHWMMYANGLTLLFEGRSADTARLTSWQYTGGPAIGFTELVAPKGVKIGGTRRDIVAAYKKLEDLGGTIQVSAPVELQFGLRGDSIVAFGSTVC
jgi:hypothetical protein